MSDDRGCFGCGEHGRKADLRPVMVVGKDEPQLLCSRCYRTMDNFDKIDHERDKAKFIYEQ